MIVFGVRRDGYTDRLEPGTPPAGRHGPPPARAGRLPGGRPRPPRRTRSAAGRKVATMRVGARGGHRSCSRRTAPTSTGPAGSTPPFGAGWCSSATVAEAVRPARRTSSALPSTRSGAPGATSSSTSTGGEGATRLRGDRRAPAVRADRLGRAVPSRRRPGAPVLARTDFDVTHPYRQKELVDALTRRAGRPIATAFEIQCVRRVHHTDARARVLPPTEVRIPAVQRVLRDAGCSRSTSATRSSSRRPRPPTAAAPSPPAERGRLSGLLRDGLDPGEGLVDPLSSCSWRLRIRYAPRA